jgi:DNA-binding response OmpR family regulator
MSDMTILLVEDNHEHAVLVQAGLQYRSLSDHVFVAESVTEAQSYLRGEWPFDDVVRTPTPHLIVLDHWLPDGSGLELLEWLAEEPAFSSIPVIVFTACREPEVREKALSYGVSDFLLKPEGFEELAKAVERVLRPWTKASRQDGVEGEAGDKAG